MTDITVNTLYQAHANSLKLSFVTGQNDANRAINGNREGCSDLIGYLNLVHPQQISVFGSHEFNYLAKLSPERYEETLNQVFSTDLFLVIVADEQEPSAEMIQKAKENQVPLMTAGQTGQRVIDHLYHYLLNHLSETLTVHGVFMEVFDKGVLLTGESGIGKSELALELINRSHRLVADDSPTFARLSPDTLTGSCPPLLQDFLEVRGLGIINARAMFGNTAIKDRKQLHLIVHVIQVSKEALSKIDRLQSMQKERQLLGVPIPEVTLPAAPGRSLAILVEAAVRNQVLVDSGYNAFEKFNLRQQQTILENSYETDHH